MQPSIYSKKEIIARRVTKELKDGFIVNLGIGIPTMVANFIPNEIEVWLQSENGFIGVGPSPSPDQEERDLVNAGGRPASLVSGGACFDSALSFGIIRGGHLDVTVLGALEVDESGSLANWIIPGKMVPGMGGAMDLVVGARKVIIAMEHVTKEGNPRILKKCTLPLTAVEVVDLIVTDMAVINVTSEGLILTEVAPGLSIDEVIALTDANLKVAEGLKEMSI